MLARGGIGEIRIIDRDVVELTNLQRQVLFEERDAEAGVPKAVAAAAAVARINSTVRALPIVADLTPANVLELLAGSSVVIDGTDNLETRLLLNDACMQMGLPWVYGGVAGSTGMAMAIVPRRTACFRCLYPHAPSVTRLETSETAGILAAAVATVAAFQWTQAVKLLVGGESDTAGSAADRRRVERRLRGAPRDPAPGRVPLLRRRRIRVPGRPGRRAPRTRPRRARQTSAREATG